MDLSVKNIDNYIKKEKNKNNYELHPLLFTPVYRLLVCCSSNSWKTNYFIDLLTTNKTCYTSLYVYSKHINQSKYKYLKKYITKLEKMLEKKGVEIDII